MSATMLLALLADTAWSVVWAVLPLVTLFLLFQVLFLQLPVSQVVRVLKGTSIAALGLFLFLVGVSLAFLPFGQAIGGALGAMRYHWLVVPLGAFLGFATTWGEPAVRILADQVEEASAGSIRRTLVIVTICAGVAVAVGLGLARIRYGIPFLWLIIPGYLLALVVLRYTDRDFVGIAIDAGGVATGPLANTFLLALAFGASSAIDGQNPLEHGLGLVALIALAPVLSVMILGVIVRRKAKTLEPGK